MGAKYCGDRDTSRTALRIPPLTRAFWISQDPERPGAFRLLATEPAENPRRHVLPSRESAERFLREQGASESQAHEAVNAAIREGRSCVFLESDDAAPSFD